MFQRRTKGPYNWLCIGGTATVAAAGIGFICYMAWTSCSSNPERQREKNSKKTSKTIIVTSTISCHETNWGDLLEEDVVLLVPPGVSFLENLQDELALHYKIIRCNKMTGLWSCVRHLRKDQLLYVASEIAEDIPADIPRYVKRVIALETDEQVRTSLS
ncbi:uncharacterized protein ZBAI_04965 [Zygosaccharomyces bailii ISA1307]|nr:uncharacterized protein ZBAI_04965 [Zygosaccharomyces bailii ISA1307]